MTPYFRLRHLVPEVFGRQVRATESHLQVGMSEDFLQRLKAPAPHDESGREVVPCVVEVEVFELRRRYGPLECRTNAPAAGQPALVPPEEPGQGIVDRLTHGHLSRRLPDFVTSSRITPRLMSTRSQVSPSSSPRRSPLSKGARHQRNPVGVSRLGARREQSGLQPVRAPAGTLRTGTRIR